MNARLSIAVPDSSWIMPSVRIFMQARIFTPGWHSSHTTDHLWDRHVRTTGTKGPQLMFTTFHYFVRLTGRDRAQGVNDTTRPGTPLHLERSWQVRLMALSMFRNVPLLAVRTRSQDCLPLFNLRLVMRLPHFEVSSDPIPTTDRLVARPHVMAKAGQQDRPRIELSNPASTGRKLNPPDFLCFYLALGSPSPGYSGPL